MDILCREGTAGKESVNVRALIRLASLTAGPALKWRGLVKVPGGIADAGHPRAEDNPNGAAAKGFGRQGAEFTPFSIRFTST